MQVGDKVWIFDSNRRRYEFVEKYILGETKQSWIVGYKTASIEERSNLKVNKKTLIYSTTNTLSLDGRLYIYEEEIDRECWLNDNHYRIKELVGECKNYDKLKKIEEILLSE